MQQSIRNISARSHKKTWRFALADKFRQGQTSFLEDDSKKLNVPVMSGKIDQKQLDSHRAPLTLRELEESKELIMHSEEEEDDQLNYLTESKDSYRKHIV